MERQLALHRTIVVIDVEARRRRNVDQVAVRNGMYRAVGEAFQQAGIPWNADACEDRGDGIFILIPPEVPKERIRRMAAIGSGSVAK